MSLVPLSQQGSGGTFLVGMTSTGTTYYPITCAFKNQHSKIFLVKEPGSGIATLTDGSLQDTVTGGKVTGCGLIRYTKFEGGGGIARVAW
jgi:hypothetical protein